MNWNSPIIFGTDKDHTKIYSVERHCYNCIHNDSNLCDYNRFVPPIGFKQKEDFSDVRFSVYMGRVWAGVCMSFKLKGIGWDR